jgi:hypothetical protein
MQDKKRKVKAVINNIEDATYEDLRQSLILKELVMKEVPAAIEEAIKSRSTFASLFEINDTFSFVEIHKRDWINALECCLVYNVQKEDYEQCSKITKLINQLKSINSKLTVKKNGNE